MEKSPLKKLEEKKNKKIYSENDLDRIKEVLEQLEKSYKKNSSLKHKLLTGIITGMGTAIGATIIAGIAIGVLTTTIDTIEDIPIIRDIIDAEAIKDATHLNSFEEE
jgi:predicted phosphoribosyltransferase